MCIHVDRPDLANNGSHDFLCYVSCAFEHVLWSWLCREGYEPQLAAVATGSHIDAIPYSGKYDGVVGVLGAIEAINVLKRFGTLLNVC